MFDESDALPRVKEATWLYESVSGRGDQVLDQAQPIIHHICYPQYIPLLMMDWLKEHHYEGPVTVAGKNAASFDIPFLKEQYGRDYGLKFRHRVLDPTSMYVQPDDDAPPSLNTCLKRAGPI